MAAKSGNSHVNVGNAHLRRAQINKNDEFYTTAYDARKFLGSCADYFADKTVYCNCDDPEESEIAKYFIRNFAKLKLKGLFCTYYRQNPEIKAYKYYYNGAKMRRKEIAGNGSFDSAEFAEIYNKIDIIVTNPPFSLAGKFVQFLLNKNIKFLIISNINIANNYLTTPCFENGVLHFCCDTKDRPRTFVMPCYCTGNKTKEGKPIIRMGVTAWLTNTEIDKRRKYVSLTKFDKNEHKTFDNWRYCVNINRLSQLPCDYEGLIAVPITILYKPVAGFLFLCFVGGKQGRKEGRIKPYIQQNGKQIYTRCLVLKTHGGGGMEGKNSAKIYHNFQAKE